MNVHLAALHGDVFEQHVGHAIQGQRDFYMSVCDESNDKLMQNIIRHFDNIQVAMDRVGDVLAVQYGINLSGMGQEEKRRKMKPLVRVVLEPIVNQRVDQGRPMPEPMAMEEVNDMSAQRAMRFLNYMGGTDQGNAMIRQFDQENIMGGGGRRPY